MTDQDNNSGTPAGTGSPVVMVEQSTAGRHKPYRPTDLQDEGPPELHHKRSRAPAVPSVAEELKNATEKEGMECENAMLSEKHSMPIVTTKLSSTTKRQASPETIAMVPLEVDVQRTDKITQPAQPIPAQVDPTASIVSPIAEKQALKEDEDSITEEIAELRTAETTQKASEWDTENRNQHAPEKQETEDCVPLQRKFANEIINNIDNETENKKDVVQETEDIVPLQRKLGSGSVNETITSTHQLKKKEISWNHSTYLDKVHPLQDFNARSASWLLERKTSVGPCYRKTLPFGQPSGITINLPKKSLKNINESINPVKSGITIIVSKRCLDNHTKSPTDFGMRNATDNPYLPRTDDKLETRVEGANSANLLGHIKGKLENLRGKIKHVLHM